jgi:hypothetical protein
MKVCESCGGMKCHPKTYYGKPVRVICGTCLGVGLLSLGYESQVKWQRLRAEALARAIREGWYEVEWAGEPGHAQKVLRLVRDAEQRRSA